MVLLDNLSPILAGFTLAAFAGVTLWLALRPRARMLELMPAPRWLIALAATTTLWCAALFAFAPGASEAIVVQQLRNLAMLGWLGATFWSADTPMARPLRLILRLLATMALIAFLSGAATHVMAGRDAERWIGPALNVASMIVAAGGLLIVDGGVRGPRAGQRMPVLAVAGGLAMLWGYELNIQLIGAITGTRASTLIALLPALAILLAPLLALSAMDVGRERIQLSRTAAMRAFILIGVAVYLVLIGLTGALARLIGGDYGDLAQGTFLIMALGAGSLLLVSPRRRAWLSVTITKHIFEHRYDYRAEWMRFTATLAHADETEGHDLNRRVARALAELTGSPGALLMLPDTFGAFHVADQWRWPGALPHAEQSLSLLSAFTLQETGHIVDLDAERAGSSHAHEDLVLPQWLLDDHGAWVVVPVLHFRRMIAVVVLQRPPVTRALDWEDLDVLRIAGQQAASYLAESQSQAALSEARRFDEFNRRFAFIMHDIKNLASQIGLLARNAERHADKAEFRADMIETLRISAGRLSDLLVRLSPRQQPPAVEAKQTLIEPILNEIAAGTAARSSLFIECDPGLAAWADRASVHQILQHLVANAIDASEAGTPVEVLAAADKGRVRIDVIDRGCGMSRAFVRTELFKPFVSTKPAGFGLGAFEALKLAEKLGGSIEVASEPGRGSSFTLWLKHAGSKDGAGALTETMETGLT